MSEFGATTNVQSATVTVIHINYSVYKHNHNGGTLSCYNRYDEEKWTGDNRSLMKAGNMVSLYYQMN